MNTRASTLPICVILESVEISEAQIKANAFYEMPRGHFTIPKSINNACRCAKLHNDAANIIINYETLITYYTLFIYKGVNFFFARIYADRYI